MPLKVRELVRKLEQLGWRNVRTNGDHRLFQGPNGRTTVVSGRLGDDVRPGTYKAVVRQTGLEEDR